jgi:hypothetical protein
VAHALNQDHSRGMTNRRPAFAIGKLNDDLVRGAVLGNPASVGLIGLLAVFYSGI